MKSIRVFRVGFGVAKTVNTVLALCPVRKWHRLSFFPWDFGCHNFSILYLPEATCSGQAVVTIAGRDHYLGSHGSKASQSAHDRLVGWWLATSRSPLKPGGLKHPLPGSKAPVTSTKKRKRPGGPTHPSATRPISLLVSSGRLANIAYTEKQMKHHKAQSFEEEYLALLAKHEVEYDKKLMCRPNGPLGYRVLWLRPLPHRWLPPPAEDVSALRA